MKPMESENGTADTKVSDSGYSNSCNSNSQRSASSKSRHSGSNSSRSSGYCGATNPDGSISDNGLQPPKRNKDKEHKVKKLKTIPVIVVQNERSTERETEAPAMDLDVPATTSKVIEPSTENLDITNPDPSMESITAHSIVEAQPDEALPEEEKQFRNLEKGDKPGNNEFVVEDDESEPDSPEVVDKNPDFQSKDGFCCVISIYDGVVLYTTPSLTSALGFPKDMWLGRSFIDFVHPKDRDTFSSQVTMGITLPLVNSQDLKNSLYVCLRKYKSLKASGFGVVEKSVSYQAFQLTVTFKRVTDAPENTFPDCNSNMFLVVVAVPVNSAYKIADEMKRSSKFGMRHTAACIFSHVDPDVVTNFGFLPQDMLGKSVFDFYHPEDMPFLKEIYESVMRMHQISGSVFRSKPYRFAVQNGGFAMIETEWSSFVNPWSRRLEFVIGLHRVLKGPKNPNLFDNPIDNEIKQIPEEVIRRGTIIQGEIRLLLNKELTRPNVAAKHEVTKRCKDLANFMASLMDEVKCSLQLQLPNESEPTISERGSVMLGEISPHHDSYDSKSSSETPPSYNQLNYNENIERFFESKPKTTTSDGSGERSCFPNIANGDGRAGSSAQDVSRNQSCHSPEETSGTSGTGSGGIFSFGSNLILQSRTTSDLSNDSYKPPHLTEAILNRHNEDMEKIMIKKHKEHRSGSKDVKRNNVKNRMAYNFDKQGRRETSYPHGVKRTGSNSWKEDSHQVTKHKHHNMGPANYMGAPEQSPNKVPSKQININQQNISNAFSNDNKQQPQQGLNDVNLWPPFSVTVTPINNTPSYNITGTHGGTGFATGLFPVYYFPSQKSELFDPNNPKYQVHYMPGMFYNTIISASPIVCSPLSMVPLPITPSSTVPQENHQMNGLHMNNPLLNGNSGELKRNQPGVFSMSQFQRPLSQATSIKAQPGSVASPGCVNKALSEYSRKDHGLPSVCSPTSPLVSPPVNEGENFDMHKNENTMKIRGSYRDTATIDEGSLYSSSYSSFFKTDGSGSGSGSNDDSNARDAENSKMNNNNSNFIKKSSKEEEDSSWIKAMAMNSELALRYEMAVEGIENILQADLNALKNINQPVAVNDQLNQLYIDMELEGLSKKLALDEGGLTSSSSSDEPAHAKSSNSRKKRRSYSSLVMIYEENAPLPSPES